MTKEQKITAYDRLATERDRWRSKNWYYYARLEKLMTSLVPSGMKVLEIGCGTGELLNSVKPSVGVGVDFSIKMLEIAKQRFPGLRFSCEDAEDLRKHDICDYVVLADLVGELQDVWQAFHELHKATDGHSRIVITHYNYLWEPLLRLADKLGLKMPQDYQNWLSPADIGHLLNLNGYEIIKRGQQVLLPIYLPLISELLNRFSALIPFSKHFCLIQYAVAKQSTSLSIDDNPKFTVSVIIPCRNERGNIEDIVKRVPDMGAETELIFVDGASTDGTVTKIEEMVQKHKGTKNIRLIHQHKTASTATSVSELSGISSDSMLKLGKGDAVRQGFDAAQGDILMILDADLTVPPEDLPKFYDAIASGKGEFINGSRLVYPMEKEAMRTLNLIANKFFSLVFTWLLGQSIKDTLCGTKVLFRTDYDNIRRNRGFFGELDPFGDFDLLFGAAKQNLKIVEVPVRYRKRTYGDTKIERFRHGLLLLRMAYIGLRKFRLFN